MAFLKRPVQIKSEPSDNVTATNGSLSVWDYMQIEQLVASYGHALDSGFGKGDNGDAYASLYTKDGLAFLNAKGYDALAALAREQPRGPNYVRHYITHHLIDPSPEGATGKAYLAVLDIGEHGKPNTVFLGGHYEDTYVRTAGRLAHQDAEPAAAQTRTAAGPGVSALTCDSERNRAGSSDMTWLPVRAESGSERDAVFGLMPEVDELLCEMLSVADQISDPWLVECCHLRQAQLMGARAALAGVDSPLRSELRTGARAPLFPIVSARRCPTPSNIIWITTSSATSRRIGSRTTLHRANSSISFGRSTRTKPTLESALLDIAPDPNPAAKPRHRRSADAEDEIKSGADANAEGGMWNLLDPAFGKVYRSADRPDHRPSETDR